MPCAACIRHQWLLWVLMLAFPFPGFWSKYAMPDGPDVASNNADIEIMAPRNEVTETTVSPGRNPAGRMRLNIKEQTLSAYW